MFLLAQIRDNIHPLLYEQYNEYKLCKRAYPSKGKTAKQMRKLKSETGSDLSTVKHEIVNNDKIKTQTC